MVADLTKPISGLAAGGVIGVGVPGPPGLSAGTSPVLVPLMSVPVLESSVTAAPAGGVPPAVAVLSNAVGAPAMFGSMFAVKVTWYWSPGSMRPSVPVISAVPVPLPVNAAPLVVGANELPDALVTIETAGAVTMPLSALPNWLAAARSSTRVSGVSPILPVFSTSRVYVTSKVPSLWTALIVLADLTSPISGAGTGGVTGVGVPGPPGLFVGSSPVLAPAISVPVFESSVTALPPGGVPPAVAVFSRAAGAPAALGSISAVNTT